MRKTEFLERLRAALNALPEEEAKKTIAYYAEMIDDRIEDGMSEEEAIRRAAGQRVRVYPLSEYSIGGTQGKRDRAAVLLGYATLTEEELEGAAERLICAWDSSREQLCRG